MIQVNLPKAKEIVHNHRRAIRAEQFKPLDLGATIPMYAEDAEAKRAAIRDQFALHQEAIDAADCPEKLKSILLEMQGS